MHQTQGVGGGHPPSSLRYPTRQAMSAHLYVGSPGKVQLDMSVGSKGLLGQWRNTAHLMRDVA